MKTFSGTIMETTQKPTLLDNGGDLWPPAPTRLPLISLFSISLCQDQLPFVFPCVLRRRLCSMLHSQHVRPPRPAFCCEENLPLLYPAYYYLYNCSDLPTSSSSFVNLYTVDYTSQIGIVKARSYGSTLPGWIYRRLCRVQWFTSQRFDSLSFMDLWALRCPPLLRKA